MSQNYRPAFIIAELGVDVDVGIFCADYFEDFQNRFQVELVEVIHDKIDNRAFAVLQTISLASSAVRCDQNTFNNRGSIVTSLKLSTNLPQSM